MYTNVKSWQFRINGYSARQYFRTPGTRGLGDYKNEKTSEINIKRSRCILVRVDSHSWDMRSNTGVSH